MSKIVTIIILVLISNYTFSQNSDSLYVKLYRYSDSIKSNNKIGVLENNIYTVASKLNALHPREYLNKSLELLKQNKYNEASYIYYLGIMRWKYYENFAVYDEKDTTFKQDLNEVINSFLRSNVTNFSTIINAAANYHLANDYSFCSKKKKPLYYDEAAALYKRMSNQFQINKDYFTTMWSKERREFENELKK
jgi:hypothetical protein